MILNKFIGFTMYQLVSYGCHIGGLMKSDNRSLMLYVVGFRNNKLLYDVYFMFYFLRNLVTILTGSIKNYYDEVLFINCNLAYSYNFRTECLFLDMPFLYTRWLGGVISNMRSIGVGGVDYKKYNLEGIWGLVMPPSMIVNLSGVYNKLSFKESRSVGSMGLGLIDFDYGFDVEYEQIKSHKYGYIDFPIPMNDDSVWSLEYMMKLISQIIITRRCLLLNLLPKKMDKRVFFINSRGIRHNIFNNKESGIFYHYLNIKGIQTQKFLRNSINNKKRWSNLKKVLFFKRYFQMTLLNNFVRKINYPFFFLTEKFVINLVISLLCVQYKLGVVDIDKNLNSTFRGSFKNFFLKISYNTYKSFLETRFFELSNYSVLYKFFMFYRFNKKINIKKKNKKLVIKSKVNFLKERLLIANSLMLRSMKYRLYYLEHPKNTRLKWGRRVYSMITFPITLTFLNCRDTLQKIVNSFYYLYYSSRDKMGLKNFNKNVYARRDFLRYIYGNRKYNKIALKFMKIKGLNYVKFDFNEKVRVKKITGKELYYYQVYEKMKVVKKKVNNFKKRQLHLASNIIKLNDKIKLDISDYYKKLKK